MQPIVPLLKEKSKTPTHTMPKRTTDFIMKHQKIYIKMLTEFFDIKIEQQNQFYVPR